MKKLLIILFLALPLLSRGQNSYTYPNTDVLVSGTQNLARMRTQSWQGNHGYIYLPKGYDSTESNRYPLICFYHGAGENGSLSALLGQGLPAVIDGGHPPYSCTTPGDTTWFIVYSVSEASMGSANSVADVPLDYRFLIDYYRLKIDTNRVYATGLSAGGNMTLEASGDNLNEFVAGVPMSTVWTTMSDEARDNLPQVWLWQIHGYNDVTANFSSAQTSINTYNTENPTHQALLATFNGAHCCWTTYYAPTWKWTSNNGNDIGTHNNLSIYDWMLTHVRGQDDSNSPPVVSAGGDKVITLPTSSVSITGTATDDHNITSTAWTVITKPSGATVTFSNASALTTTVNGLTISGTYTIRLTATDDSSATAYSNATITVNEAEVQDTADYKIVIDPDLKMWHGDTLFYQLNDVNSGGQIYKWFDQQNVADPQDGDDTQDSISIPSISPNSLHWPLVGVIDLGAVYKVSNIWISVQSNSGWISFNYGNPNNWSTDTITLQPTGNGWKNAYDTPFYTRYIKVYGTPNKGGSFKMSEIYFYGHLVGSDSLSRIQPTLSYHKPTRPMKAAIGTNMQWTPNELFNYFGNYRYYLNDYMADNPDEHNIDSLQYTFGKPGAGTIYYRFPEREPKKSSVTPGNNEYAVPTLAIDSGASIFWYASVGLPSWYSAQGIYYPIDITSHPDRDSVSPASYDRIARRYWNRAAVYGNGDVPADSLYQVTYPTNFNNGVMKYVEPGNELDNDWAQFHMRAHEFEAYMSAVYDGDANTMGSRLGIKNADASIKVVQPGMARDMATPLYLQYSKALYYFSRYGRPDHKSLPFDIANFHLYFNQGTLDDQHGVPPEQDSGRATIRAYYDMINEQVPGGMEIWWSEFGYDWNGNGGQSVPGEGIGTLDSMTLQAAWTIRDILAGSGYVDLFTQYQMLDVNDAGGTYSTSGLVTSKADSGAVGYYPHPSFYYLATFRNVLGNYVFDREVRRAAGDSVWVYKFKNLDNDSVAYVVWCPTMTDHRIDNMAMKTGHKNTPASVVSFADKTLYGDQNSQTSLADSTVFFEITEVPKIILTTDGANGGQLVQTEGGGDDGGDDGTPTPAEIKKVLLYLFGNKLIGLP